MRSTFLALLGSTTLLAAAPVVLARRRWSVVAGACLIAAVALWIVVGVNAAFVAATLGVLAWFWDQRNRYKALLPEDAGGSDTEVDAEDDEVDEVDGDDETSGGGRDFGNGEEGFERRRGS
ncbi:MAG: hypothetical protein ACJ741_14845 [Pyrinomonadaceae bacterium]